MIFLFKKLKISIINQDQSKTTFEKVIQVNWINFYYIKLCKIIKTSFLIKVIIIYHFLNSVIGQLNVKNIRSN